MRQVRSRMDEQLVIRAQDGDQAAFAMLAVEVGPRFHAVAALSFCSRAVLPATERGMTLRNPLRTDRVETLWQPGTGAAASLFRNNKLQQQLETAKPCRKRVRYPSRRIPHAPTGTRTP